MSLLMSFPVCAGETLTKENFDYRWYLEQHPDLAAVMNLEDSAAVWDFYQNIGLPSGWNGRVAPEHLIQAADFDYMRYAAENPDAAAAFGTDAAALYHHYKTSGIAEGRKGSSTSEEVNAALAIYRIADELAAGCISEEEKVKAAHDWLVCNTAYDYDNYVRGAIPYSSYHAAGPVLYQKAVCQGYAEAFQVFMDAMGIEGNVIFGTADNGSGVWSGHAWNKVKADGSWYYVDTTWDDPVPDRVGRVYWYRYYLTADKTFGGDHRPEND